MITSIQTPGPAPQPAIRLKATESTPPPSDTVDFSKIDSATRAALLPAMDPAVQLGVQYAAAAAILAGMGGGAPAVTLDVVTRTQGVESQATCTNTRETGSKVPSLQVKGEFAGQPVSGRLLVDEKRGPFGWTGRIGPNAEEIQVTSVDEVNTTMHLTTKFGEVAGQLDVMALWGGEVPGENFQGYLVTGTLGGQPYRLETRIQWPGGHEIPPFAGGRLEVPVHARGSVGDSGEISNLIAKDYTLVFEEAGEGHFTARMTGGGTVAGIPQEVEANLTVVL
jgi:hypothetical protein